MKLTDYSTKIFIDSSDPDDTRKALSYFSVVHGQTTNPSLVAKNPDILKRIEDKGSISEQELLDSYKAIVTEISNLIPEGSVSIEVYADNSSTSAQLLGQAEIMNSWISNAHIKFPTTTTGLEAAHIFVANGGRANMTLGFTESQALAVHQATERAPNGNVFYSSFVGRVFDKGINGIQLLQSVIDGYRTWNSHVQVLAASFRTLDQLKGAVLAGSDIVTIPPKMLDQWSQTEFEIEEGYEFSDMSVKDYQKEDIKEGFQWREDLIVPDQAREGVEKFATDWNSLMQ